MYAWVYQEVYSLQAFKPSFCAHFLSLHARPSHHTWLCNHQNNQGSEICWTLRRDAAIGITLARVMKQYVGSLHVYSRPISGSRPTRISRVTSYFQTGPRPVFQEQGLGQGYGWATLTQQEAIRLGTRMVPTACINVRVPSGYYRKAHLLTFFRSRQVSYL
jgi:hypothetical protein